MDDATRQDLAALADGTLPPEARASLLRRIDASPELADALLDQHDALIAIRATEDEEASPRLRAMAEAMAASAVAREAASGRRRRGHPASAGAARGRPRRFFARPRAVAYGGPLAAPPAAAPPGPPPPLLRPPPCGGLRRLAGRARGGRRRALLRRRVRPQRRRGRAGRARAAPFPGTGGDGRREDARRRRRRRGVSVLGRRDRLARRGLTHRRRRRPGDPNRRLRGLPRPPDRLRDRRRLAAVSRARHPPRRLHGRALRQRGDRHLAAPRAHVHPRRQGRGRTRAPRARGLGLALAAA